MPGCKNRQQLPKGLVRRAVSCLPHAHRWSYRNSMPVRVPARSASLRGPAPITSGRCNDPARVLAASGAPTHAREPARSTAQFSRPWSGAWGTGMSAGWICDGGAPGPTVSEASARSQPSARESGAALGGARSRSAQPVRIRSASSRRSTAPDPEDLADPARPIGLRRAAPPGPGDSGSAPQCCPRPGGKSPLWR